MNDEAKRAFDRIQEARELLNDAADIAHSSDALLLARQLDSIALEIAILQDLMTKRASREPSLAGFKLKGERDKV